MRVRWYGAIIGLAVLMAGASAMAAGSTPITYHRVSLTTSQIFNGLASASDPGLPATVGSVDGVSIGSQLLAKAEYGIWTNTGAKIGSTLARTEAFNELVQQQLEWQQAKSLNLLPSLAVAKQQAIARGLPTTVTELQAIQEEDGIVALAHKIMAAAQGEPASESATIGQASNPITNVGASAWNAYVSSLVGHANVQVFAKF